MLKSLGPKAWKIVSLRANAVPLSEYGLNFTWFKLQGKDITYSMDNKVQHVDYMPHHKHMDLLHYPN